MPRKPRTPSPKTTAPSIPVYATAVVSREFLHHPALRYALLALILVLAGFLRLNQLATVPLGISPDEAMEGSNALEALETHNLQVFYPENNGREGLYANAVVPSIALFGNTKLALRLPAAISGTLTVLGLYCLAAELFETPIALLASFLLATSFWHLVASRLAGHAIMAPLFFVWTLFFLVRALLRLGHPRFPVVAVLCGGVTSGLGFHTYASFRIAPLLIGLILLAGFVHAKSAGLVRRFALLSGGYLAIAALLCLPLALYFSSHPEMLWNRARQVSVFNATQPGVEIVRNILKTAQMFFFEGDRNWRHNYSGDRELFWLVAIFFLAGVVLAARELLASFRAARERPVDIWNWLRGLIGIGWLLIGAIPVVLSDEGMPHALRSLLFAPAVFLLAAWGAWHLYCLARARMPGPLPVAGACLLVLVLAAQPYFLYFESWAKRPEVPVSHLAFVEHMAEAIERLPDQTAKYVVLNTQLLPVRGIPLIAQPIMYLTGSFTVRGQAERHIHYVTQENTPALGLAPDHSQSLCERVNAAFPDAETFCIE